MGDLDEPLGLSESERRRIVVEWNNTTSPFPQVSVAELLAAQVARTPESPSVTFADLTLTFAEFDAAAGRLDRHLRNLGVGPGVLVAAYVERSVDMVVALAGIAKAGGAYVPLDPDFPADRLSFMLDDSAAAVVVTQSRLLESLPPNKAQVVCIDRDLDDEIGEASPADAVRSGAGPDDLAYVIYTSGSTGRPKGVEIPHRALVNFLTSMAHRPGLGPDDVLLAVTTSSFDMAGLELWLPLVTGAHMVIASRDAVVDPNRLIELLDEAEATVLQATPATWRMLVEAGWPGRPGLKALCGGEALPVALADRLVDRGLALWNMYGPTETTIWSTALEVTTRGQALTVGRPIANTTLYILDAARSPVAVGIVGELYIGGAGLARGYLGRPDLTAERFVAHPFDPTPGTRVYKTGDMARWRPDGTVDFLGRLDHQVKVRGYRIECGEVEAAIEAHPGVRATVVVAREDSPGDTRLIAYLVPDDDGVWPRAESDEAALAANPVAAPRRAERSRTLAAELRVMLRASLPEYMVPSVFVPLDVLPLTPTGKVDRKALPAPAATRPGPAGTLVSPRTATEETLVAIWAEVLGIDALGIHDDFFDLGGHSLLAVKVVSKTRDALAVEIPLRAMFEAPTVAGLAEVVDDLKAGGQDTVTPALTVRPDQNQAPLSFAQESLWFLDQLIPDNPFYNVPSAYRLSGPLDHDALEQALSEIVSRHQALRTTFPAPGGRPHQRIAPPSPMSVPVDDLSGRSATTGETEARRLAGTEAARPFDLARGPLIRSRLLRLGPEEHVLLITVHHIVSDGWSTGVLLRELSALYAAFCDHQPSPLPPLPVQYADYAVWQRGWLEGKVLDSQLTYWQTRLAGAPTALELPADQPRPPIPTYRGAMERLEVSAETASDLRALGRSRGATFYMTLLAAFNVLLARATGTDDIVVGGTTAGRGHADLDALVGFFVNTLVLRTDLSGDPTFTDLIDRVRQTALEAYEHQDAPFDKVVERIAPPRDLSRNPLVQVAFEFQEHTHTPNELGPALTCTDLGGFGGADYGAADGGIAARLDVELFVVESAAGSLEASLYYATDLFHAPTISHLADHYRRLLEAAAADPTMRVRDLPTLSAKKSHQVVEREDRTGARLPDCCQHQLFEAQVQRLPQALAVVFEDTSLTYAELDARANRLAHHLQDLGVGPEVLVGVCMGRSLDLTVGLLAVLKAGGACVPLDPTYPPERLAFMVRDAAIATVLTCDAVVGRLPDTGAHRVRLDGDADLWSTRPATAPPCHVGPENAAYVIYTSGSTGQPKGVVLTHQGLVNHHRAAVDLYALGPDDRALQFCSIGFDASIEEIFPSWAAGATVVLRSDDVPILGRGWLAWLKAQQVSVLNLPTAYWHEWARDLDRLGEVVPDDVRLVIVGGEKAQGTALRTWLAVGGSRPRWVNAYGPTEATCMTAVYERPQDGAAEYFDDKGDPPIGRPLPNTTARVVDERGEPVPPGVTGELLVGGVGLARGYLNHPALTAERFVDFPAGEGSPERLYRTGDLVRMSARGVLEYVGRLDDQVKIRGFRVECGEVEAALVQHPLVAGAVVIARQDPPGDRKLVGYVVARGSVAATPTELRRFLSDRLPDHMVPSTFLTLDSFPLTSHGKVDRAGLAQTDPKDLVADRILVMPGTESEKHVASIWARVLNIDVTSVSIDDDFFALGGHSLLATQVIAQIREEFGTETPLRAIFTAPTVADLAALVAGETKGAVQGPPLTAQPREPHARFPLSVAQEQMWAFELTADPPGLYNVTAIHRFDGPVDEGFLRNALAYMVERHETLRTSFVVEGGLPHQVVGPARPIALTVSDIRAASADERDAEVLHRTAEHDAKPFDLTRAPLVRAQLLRLNGDTSQLLVTLDHLICDGTSAAIFMSELLTAYDALHLHRLPDLPPIEIQFADFACWQRQWLTDQVLDGQLAWWTGALKGMPLGPAVPFDRVPAAPSRRISSQTFTITSDSYNRIRHLARASQTSVFIVCAAAVAAVLSREGGMTDIVVSTTLSGRQRAELEGLIGTFAGVGRIRTDLSGDPSFIDIVDRTRTSVLGMFEHQDIPFLRVREALVPDFPTVGPAIAAALPVELGYFHTPGGESAEQELFFRGQLHPLSITLLDDGAEIRGTLSYKLDFYDPGTVTRLREDLPRVLEAVTRTPSVRLSQLQISR